MLLLIIQQQRTHVGRKKAFGTANNSLWVQFSFKDSRGILKLTLTFDLCENTQTDEVWFVPLRKEEAWGEKERISSVFINARPQKRLLRKPVEERHQPLKVISPRSKVWGFLHVQRFTKKGYHSYVWKLPT